MSNMADWDRWLTHEDSVHALAPDGYDDSAALQRINELREHLVRELAPCHVRTASPDLYQDGTGLTHFRVTTEDDSRRQSGTLLIRGPALALVVLSHFGELATIKECVDEKLIDKIRKIMDGLAFKYIPYGYMERNVYNGKCGALVGRSWAERYFSMAIDCRGGSVATGE